MELAELIAALPDPELRGDGGVEVSGLAYEDRGVRPGSLFVCVAGMSADGHEFAPAALERGASALLVERFLDLDVPQVRVGDARAAMAPLAVRFFGDPTAELTLVGITGTNGKTTTAFLVRHLLEAAGTPTGLLGTVKRIVGGASEEVERTTPEAIDLQATFRRMLEAGDRACVMEVSSHALVLGRARGLRFDAAAFTNLTQDHLDFHADMEDYFAAKRFLFVGGEGTEPPAAAAINVADPYGARLAAELSAAGGPAPVTFSVAGGEAEMRATGVEFDARGSRFTCEWAGGSVEVETALPGAFNVENALAALALTQALGADVEAAAGALAGAERVPGRFEPIDEGQPFAVLVDYAHTPDSLENLLRAARRLTEGRLISVFGCGGDRDREKRPLMGGIGAELSDEAIVTSDNPRSEDPGAIIEEILAGVGEAPVEVEPDRRTAIARALEWAGPGDVVVIAGKGHEQGQELEGGRKIPFDDRDVAREELRRLAAAAS
jgi:UDP-N-acetylmuramoyl-L-alanyl-D-glutamate--2,6-diaminopimelate ligase